MTTRRDFLALASTTVPLLRPGAAALAEPFARDDRAPAAIASDEDAWVEVQRAYTVDRSILNLNNGGVCPAPRIVQEALRRYQEHAQEAPAYVLWRLQDPEKETVRAGLAGLFGRDPEEIAITRNASEALENVQLGLALERGDEVVTTDQDYPRMLTTWRQRERRDGIVLRQVELPVPVEDDAAVVSAFEAAITPRTKVIHLCHVINLTGQILPVKRVVALARPRGIDVVVDGAHAFGHLDFRHDAVDCDFYGTSLHKFLSAPHGTGMLFVRKERLRDVWPLMAAGPELDGDVRKFEEIGTHSVGVRLAIAEAIAFHLGIGPARKEARLRFLRDRWAKRVAGMANIRLWTSLAPGRSTGVALVEVLGVPAVKLQEHLWLKHRIYTVAIEHARFRGIRVSPHVCTTVHEVDRFGDALEKVAREGLPS
ncbi:MAG: aminotransferase class V-fold PLP-dependent enzyme [Planctomycetota bacterium]|nr:aminotransferase class V-fold PLP-dependent enzyme [Planctomycetota bacterium]